MRLDHFGEYRRTVMRLAYKVLRRVTAAGMRAPDIEDIYQELSVAYLIAKRHYRPETQVPFGAYLMRGMYQHINRWVSDQMKQDKETAFSLDQSVLDDDEGSLGDVIPNDEKSPEDLITERDAYQQTMSKLSPRARKFIELLESPPPELVREVRAMQARAAYGKQRGFATPSLRGVTTSVVFDVMGSDRWERTKINRELKLALGMVNQT